MLHVFSPGDELSALTGSIRGPPGAVDRRHARPATPGGAVREPVVPGRLADKPEQSVDLRALAQLQVPRWPTPTPSRGRPCGAARRRSTSCGPNHVWPFFAEHPGYLDRGLGLVAGPGPGPACGHRANEYLTLRILETFPALPPRWVPPVLELAFERGAARRRATRLGGCSPGSPTPSDTEPASYRTPTARSRAGAAAWLGRLGRREALAPLTAALAAERQEAVRAELLTALEALGADLSAHLSPEVLTADAAKGRKVKCPATPPRARRSRRCRRWSDDDPDLVKEARQQLSAHRTELKQVVTQQTARLFEAMCSDRTWPVDEWRRHLLAHPIVGRLAQRLVCSSTSVPPPRTRAPRGASGRVPAAAWSTPTAGSSRSPPTRGAARARHAAPAGRPQQMVGAPGRPRRGPLFDQLTHLRPTCRSATMRSTTGRAGSATPSSCARRSPGAATGAATPRTTRSFAATPRTCLRSACRSSSGSAATCSRRRTGRPR